MIVESEEEIEHSDDDGSSIHRLRAKKEQLQKRKAEQERHEENIQVSQVTMINTRTTSSHAFSLPKRTKIYTHAPFR